MRVSVLRAALAAGVAGLALLPEAALAQSSANEAALEARVKQLEAAVAALQAQLAAQPKVAPGTMAATTAAPTGGPAVTGAAAPTTEQRVAALEKREGFLVGSTTVKAYGFIKVTGAWSNFRDGELPGNALGREGYIPAQIPIGAPGQTYFDFNAKQTRLGLTTATPAGSSVLKGLVEIDFMANPGPGSERTTNAFTPSLRRAFASWGGLLVGQEWTNFQNVATLPETTDYIGPTEGTVFVRQAQLRYTFKLGDGLNLSLAAENSESGTATAAAPVLIENDDDKIPDVTAKLAYSGGFGELTLAAIGRDLSVDLPAQTIKASAFGWGVSGAGKLMFGADKRHDIRFMLTYGEGIGRYVGLNFAPDAIFTTAQGGQLDPVGVLAGFGAVRLAWNAKGTLRSTIMGSFQKDYYPDNFATGTFNAYNAEAWSVAANLFWTPVKSFDVGMEFRRGERLIGSGSSGVLDRLEFAAKYSF